MTLTPRFIQLLAVAIAATLLLAVSLASWPLDGVLSGLAMLPLAMGQVSLVDIKDSQVKMVELFEQFKTRNDGRLKTLEDHIYAIEKKIGRPGALYSQRGSGGADSPEDLEKKAAFLAYIRTGDTGGMDRKAMSNDSGPDGGFMVPKEMDNEISKVLVEVSPMRRLARVVDVSSADYAMIHSVGGTTYAWAGEREARPETNTPQFQEIRPPMGELYAMPKLTQQHLEDNAYDIENWLIGEISEAFSAGEGDAWINGTGVKKPRGILTYDIGTDVDGTRSDEDLQYVASGASGAFAASNPGDKLVKLVHALKPRYRPGAAWLMNTTTLEQVRTFKDTAGNYLWRAGLEAGQPDTLLGYPVAEDENMPDIASNSLSIAFGNFKRGYTILDRSTMSLRDPFSAKPFVMFYSTRRVGGAIRDTRAIKLMKFAAS